MPTSLRHLTSTPLTESLRGSRGRWRAGPVSSDGVSPPASSLPVSRCPGDPPSATRGRSSIPRGRSRTASSSACIRPTQRASPRSPRRCTRSSPVQSGSSRESAAAAPSHPELPSATAAPTRSKVWFAGLSMVGRSCRRSVPGTWRGSSSWLGVIMLLRAAGAVGLAGSPPASSSWHCLPPVWYCVEMYAHPQDIVALGFALAAAGSALRGSWLAAGILVALAVLTQQYTLLVAIPLLSRLQLGAECRSRPLPQSLRRSSRSRSCSSRRAQPHIRSSPVPAPPPASEER